MTVFASPGVSASGRVAPDGPEADGPVLPSSHEPLLILLAKPRGFCAGVVRAIDIVERAINLHGAPVYVRHEIVHNTHVVEQLREQGAVFVAEVEQIPEKAVTIFSAHGVSREVEKAATLRGLDVIDATCPLVLKVHHQGQRYAALDYDVVLIGHAGHAEVEGTRGQITGRLHVIANAAEVAALVIRNPEKIAYITQTTLSVQDTRDVITALQERFPAIVGPDIRNICYATQNRQAAVQAMAKQASLILVVGSPSSSNSSRLREIAEQAGAKSHLIEGPSMVDPHWLEGVKTLGLSAGASAPEQLVQETIQHIRQFREVVVKELEGIEENVVFRLPGRLVEASAA
jgi:4-hydroxy-3-methylbut-2-en-1-yl diphosphate reductase